MRLPSVMGFYSFCLGEDEKTLGMVIVVHEHTLATISTHEAQKVKSGDRGAMNAVMS
jgi:hypothetical protein